jgi:hypothetical protein
MLADDIADIVPIDPGGIAEADPDILGRPSRPGRCPLTYPVPTGPVSADLSGPAPS